MNKDAELAAAMRKDRVARLTDRSQAVEFIDRIISGLVRGCEMLEQRDEKHAIWDDAVRNALADARGLGWGGPPPPNMATKGGNEAFGVADYADGRVAALPRVTMNRLRELANPHLVIPLDWRGGMSPREGAMHRRVIEAQHLGVAVVDLLDKLEAGAAVGRVDIVEPTPTDQCPICEMGSRAPSLSPEVFRWTCGHWIDKAQHQPAIATPGPTPGTGAVGRTGIVGRAGDPTVVQRIEALERVLFGEKLVVSPNYPQPPAPPPGLLEKVDRIMQFIGFGDHQVHGRLITTIFNMAEARIAREREHVEADKQRRSPRGRLQALLWWGHSRLYPRPSVRDVKPASGDSVEGIFSDAGNGSLS